MLLKLIQTNMAKEVISKAFLPRHNPYSTAKYSYQETISTLNELQTNASVLQKARQSGKLRHSDLDSTQIATTHKYLLRSGITIDELDTLSVIHISGTKGKGSTSAFCESILRHNGYRTGFYSSPHLVSVRERFRLNGLLIGEDIFIDYFWEVYNKLYKERENEDDMPAYFKFLTLLAFNIFLKEMVDVAIIEVGIGGEYDCTNILRRVPVVGITTLDLDHTSLLGNTIEDIAWQKAGIMKSGCQAFTVEQNRHCLGVLKSRSIEKGCSLQVVPPYTDYNWEVDIPTLGIRSDIQLINASLAIQLSHAWMSKEVKSSSLIRKIPSPTVDGLINCKWPGRTQILQTNTGRFFLDGAHTLESMKICIKWYMAEIQNSQHAKILIFNTTGDRDSEAFLAELQRCEFDQVIFVPNISTLSNTHASDQANFTVTEIQQMSRCRDHRNIWMQLLKNTDSVYMHKPADIAPSVSHALNNLQKQPNINVLVTGSLYLVGAVLKLLDPELKS